MNREIKFRLWVPPSKDWPGEFRYTALYGCFYNLWGSTAGTMSFTKLDGKGEYGLPNKNAVIQQNTGLKDKNGKEIYEGDIVKEHHFEDWGDKDGFEYIGAVRYKTYDSDCAGNKYSGFVTFPNLDKNEDYTGNKIRKDCEVIGNIMENPELLYR